MKDTKAATGTTTSPGAEDQRLERLPALSIELDDCDDEVTHAEFMFAVGRILVVLGQRLQRRARPIIARSGKTLSMGVWFVLMIQVIRPSVIITLFC